MAEADRVREAARKTRRYADVRAGFLGEWSVDQDDVIQVLQHAIDAGAVVLADDAAERAREAQGQALREAADAWQQGEWAKAPRRPDRVQERIASAQHVTDWLRARARREAGSECVGRCEFGTCNGPVRCGSCCLCLGGCENTRDDKADPYADPPAPHGDAEGSA